MATEFRIHRADVVAKVGKCALIDIFDLRAKRKGTPDLVFPDGWKEEHSLDLLRLSPRALWMMAKAGLIPVSENAALELIVAAGKKIEPLVRQVAKVRVRRHAVGSTGALLLKAGVSPLLALR